jgi:hypothetical protein
MAHVRNFYGRNIDVFDGLYVLNCIFGLISNTTDSDDLQKITVGFQEAGRGWSCNPTHVTFICTNGAFIEQQEQNLVIRMFLFPPFQLPKGESILVSHFLEMSDEKATLSQV